MLYPLVFNYVVKDYIWGGKRLSLCGRPLPASGRLAESWEISAHANGPSVILNGTHAGKTLAALCAECPDELLGPKRSGDEFPFLIKFIDAAADLSVQVHPNNREAAGLTPPGFGKNELWYILDAPDEARLVCGVKPGTDRDTLRTAAEAGNMQELLRYEKVKPGEVVNIPAGTVHAITAGLFVCEIQQNSDITYRLYDYDRVDQDGKKRELHIERGLAVSDLEDRSRHVFSGLDEVLRDRDGTEVGLCRRFVHNAYFAVDRWTLKRNFFLPPSDGFRTLSVLSGTAELRYLDEEGKAQNLELQTYHSVLLPYAVSGVELIPREGSCAFLIAAENTPEEQQAKEVVWKSLAPNYADKIALEAREKR